MTEVETLTAKADAMFSYLLTELGETKAQAVRLVGEISLRDSRIKELEDELARIKPVEPDPA